MLLAVVAAAAAVLSFSALQDLALRCGFNDQLAWLLPVVVDAGAAAGSVVWLTTKATAARTFGRRLALALLGSGVVENGVAHLLDTTRCWPCRPTRDALSGTETGPERIAANSDTPQDERGTAVAAGNFVDTRKVAVHGPAPATSPVQLAQVADGSKLGDLPEPNPAAAAAEPTVPDAGNGPPSVEPMGQSEEPLVPRTPDGRASELIAAGLGRRRLARELDITEHEARRLKAAASNGSTT